MTTVLGTRLSDLTQTKVINNDKVTKCMIILHVLSDYSACLEYSHGKVTHNHNNVLNVHYPALIQAPSSTVPNLGHVNKYHSQCLL